VHFGPPNVTHVHNLSTPAGGQQVAAKVWT